MVRVLRMLQVRGGQGSEQRRQRAPHLTEVLQKLSVKRFTATSCNGLRTPGEGLRVSEIVALRPADVDPLPDLNVV
jgi:integrase